MASLVVDGGYVRWSTDPFTTVSAADAYAAARGWTDWAALQDAQKTAAILDATTFIRVAYRAPTVAGDAIELMISDAATEAARLSLSGPLLGGAEAAEPQLIRKKTGPLEKEWAPASRADQSRSRLSLVSAMLAAAGAVRLGGVNVRLLKS